MSPEDLRNIQRWDLSGCLHYLRSRPLEDWRAVLLAEQSRRRPRVRHLKMLTQRIAEREGWDLRLSEIQKEMTQRGQIQG